MASAARQLGRSDSREKSESEQEEPDAWVFSRESAMTSECGEEA